jgi:hypothetical protein
MTGSPADGPYCRGDPNRVVDLIALLGEVIEEGKTAA